MLILAAAAAAAPTCDYRLVEESKYSAFSLHGLSTTKSICMNDYFSTSHDDMTLQDVIDAPNATIRENALKIAKRTINGTDTTSLVILDLEYPIQYNEMWFYNDSLLAAIVGAVRRRVQITQSIFPRAPIALYDGYLPLAVLYDRYLELITASMLLSFSISVYCYASSFWTGELLAAGGTTGPASA